MKIQLWVGLGFIPFGLLRKVRSFLFTRLKSAELKSSKPASLPRTDADGSLQVGDRTRYYDLHVPSSYIKGQSLPLVLVFHGAGGDGRAMQQLTGFSQLAEQEKFLVVYPDAIDKHWDARRRVQPETKNDIGFISALIEQLEQDYTLDRNRIYVTGFSNGGMFAHRVACELSDKIAAGAVVAATMPENLSRISQPSQPVSMLLIHGTDDPAVPYGSGGKALLSVADTVKYWVAHNHCTVQQSQEVLSANSGVRLEAYKQSSNQTTVMLYTIEGGSHAWPNSSSGSGTPSRPSHSIDASTIIWDFFSKHSNTKD